MLYQSSRALASLVGLFCVFSGSSCRQHTSAATPPVLSSPSVPPSQLIPDQSNTAPWQNAWTNLVNDVRQSFTPSLPKLVGVEVQLVLGNPGPPDDRLTVTILDSSDHVIGIVSKTVSAADYSHVLFVFPSGGVQVSPGQLYSLRLSGGITFGWKYVLAGYEHGSASFNGHPLLPGARSTFLFQTFGTE